MPSLCKNYYTENTCVTQCMQDSVPVLNLHLLWYKNLGFLA